MLVWLRFLVVWLVAIALPVQGIAGVTLAHCAKGQERMGAAVPVTAHQHAGQDDAVAHRHDRHASQGIAAADLAQAAQEPVKTDKMSHLGQHTCSSCESCCSGSALSSAMPRMPQVAAAQAVFAEEVVSVDAFVSSGPDRPPRTCLV